MLAARNLAEDGELPLLPDPAAGGGNSGGGGGGGDGGGGGSGGALPALPAGLDSGVAAVHGLVLRVACCPLQGLRLRLQLPCRAAAAEAAKAKAVAPASSAKDDRWGRRWVCVAFG